MTREEAKDNLIGLSAITGNPDYVDFFLCENLIDAIYDDFESRVCKNCKYANWELNWCDNKDNEFREGAYFKVIHISKNFGCNRFKRK